jgi:hypothetical protein
MSESGVFSETLFGAELAARLDAVFATSQALPQFHLGSSALFAAPSGLSFNEADVLTLKHYLMQPDDPVLRQLRVDLNTRWLHCMAAASLDHRDETARQFRAY